MLAKNQTKIFFHNFWPVFSIYFITTQRTVVLESLFRVEIDASKLMTFISREFDLNLTVGNSKKLDFLLPKSEFGKIKKIEKHKKFKKSRIL